MRPARIFCVSALLVPLCSLAQAMTSPTAPQEFKTYNTDIKYAVFQNLDSLDVQTHSPNDTQSGLVVLPGPAFHNGTIALEIAGEVGPKADPGARGFVGIAFHVAGPYQYEAFYLRPTNGRADDQLRRNHSLQYISYPNYSFDRLRHDAPGKYESYADLQPGVWTKVRIEVLGTKAKLFVNGAEQPSLIVNDLKRGDNSGGVAYWIGPGAIGHFRGLMIERDPD